MRKEREREIKGERTREGEESSGKEKGNRYNFTAEHAGQRAVVRQTGFHT